VKIDISEFVKHERGRDIFEEVLEEARRNRSFPEFVMSNAFVQVCDEPRADEIRSDFFLLLFAEALISAICKAALHGNISLARALFLRVISPGLRFYKNAFGQPFDLSASAVRHRLTDREKSILPLLERGIPMKGIAGQLDISINTVKASVQRLIRKTKSHSAIEAIYKLRTEPDPSALFAVGQEELERLLAELKKTRASNKRCAGKLVTRSTRSGLYPPKSVRGNNRRSEKAETAVRRTRGRGQAKAA
jgi:DNA-binding CsgD family transcriptional regulator